MRDEQAVTSPLGQAMLVAIVLVIVVLLGWTSNRLLDDTPEPPIESGARATYGLEGYWVEPTGPSDIPVPEATLAITRNGVREVVPMTDWSGGAGPQTWRVGTRLCIVGPGPDCWKPNGTVERVELFAQGAFVFRLDALRSPASPFVIVGAGGVSVASNTTTRLEALGALISCGGGAEIPVWAEHSKDGGATWTHMNGGNPIPSNGGPFVEYVNLPPTAVLGVRGRATLASCSNFNSQYDSLSGDPHVLTLRGGDPAPDYAPYQGQEPLAAFLQPYVNTQTKTMVLAPNQVMLLFEFNPSLSSSAADFQDLVMLYTIN